MRPSTYRKGVPPEQVIIHYNPALRLAGGQLNRFERVAGARRGRQLHRVRYELAARPAAAQRNARPRCGTCWPDNLTTPAAGC